MRAPGGDGKNLTLLMTQVMVFGAKLRHLQQAGNNVAFPLSGLAVPLMPMSGGDNAIKGVGRDLGRSTGGSIQVGVVAGAGKDDINKINEVSVKQTWEQMEAKEDDTRHGKYMWWPTPILLSIDAPSAMRRPPPPLCVRA